MPSSRFLESGTSSIWIETDSANVSNTALAPSFVKALQQVSQKIAQGLGDLDSGAQPSEMTLSFAIKIESNGQFLITDASSGTGNFAIQMKFAPGANSNQVPKPPQF